MPYFRSHICLKGHATSHPLIEVPDKYCISCGEPIITCCPSCKTEITFFSNTWGAMMGEPPEYRPLHCKECAKPYPWTELAIEGVKELIEEDAALTYTEREKLIRSIPDLVSDTPKTGVAILRFKKALMNVGKDAAPQLLKFAIDFGCAALNNSLAP